MGGIESGNFVCRGEEFGSNLPFGRRALEGIGSRSGDLDERGSFITMSDPGTNPAIEKPDSLDSGIEQSPGQSGGSHRAIGIGSVNDDEGVGKNTDVLQSESELVVGEEVSIRRVIVVGIVFRAISACFQIGGVHLKCARKVGKELVDSRERVIGGAEVRLDELARLMRVLEELLEFKSVDQLEIAESGN